MVCDHKNDSLALFIELAKLLSGRELIAITAIGVLGSIGIVTDSGQVHLALSLVIPMVVLVMALRR